MSKFINPFQEKIWRDKYQYKKESFKGFCERIADNVFKEDELDYRNKLFNLLYDSKVLFGGRTNSNIGIDEKGLTLFNCFIEAVKGGSDSLEGILDLVRDFAITLKTEGGVGFCANFLRPANTVIRKIGVTTPGSIKFLELFDKTSEIITSGNVEGVKSFQGKPTKKSIRKGATMVTMSACHPDIEEFITAKTAPNRLTKCNMSVLVTNAFMYAVENDLDWQLWFPDISFEKYDTEWDGNFEVWAEKGYPVVIYKTLKAVDLYDLLLKNTYSRNEPGILFIDNIRKMDNLQYLEGASMLATNPCVTGNTLLHTENGLERIETLYNRGNDNNVFVDNRRINNELGTSLLPATHVYKTGHKDVYKITTKSGYSIDATEYHRFPTDEGDKELKDLKIGDSLWMCSGEGGFGQNGNAEFGRLLGLVAGDGTIYEGHSKRDNCSDNRVFIRLWGKDKEIADEMVETVNTLIKEYGGRFSNVSVSKRYIESRDMYEIKSSVLYRIFEDLGLLNLKTEVPDFILTGSRECVVGYLQGLFQADGTVNVSAKSRCSIKLNGSVRSLLSDIQVLLTNFGIMSRIYLRRAAGYRKLPDGKGGLKDYFCKDNYELILFSISRDKFMNVIGFMLDYKNDKFFDWRPNHEPYTHPFKDAIITIEKMEKQDVYCLTEEKHGSIICNGISTLQCGEVPGSTGETEYKGNKIKLGDVCNLGSINLTKYYNVKTGKLNMEGLMTATATMVRALDNIIDISDYPLQEYEDASKLKRKIGLGVMGIGSLFMMMDVRYGCDESIEILDEILSKIINKAYETSALLAKEKGPFPLYDEAILDGGFVKNGGVLTEDTVELIKKHGLRNSALMAIAPNGTLSIVAGNISGGLEPVYSKEYYRWNRVEGKLLDFEYPRIHKGEWFETDYLKEDRVADENILLSVDGKYRIDKNNGLSERITIRDYGYNVAVELGNKNVDGAMDLTIDEHLAVLASFAKYVDQSCSKTINLPKDISFEDFKELYGRIYSYGVKGCTTYREGSTVSILESTDREEEKKTIDEQQKEFLETFKSQDGNTVVVQDVKLPEEYPAKGFILKSEGKKWYLHVAFKDLALTRPFAVFVNTNHREDNVSTFTALEELVKLAESMGLNNGRIEEVKNKYAYQKNPVKICRMLGFLLRHNVRAYHIVQALDNVEEAGPGTFVFRMKKFMAQYIRCSDEVLICPECGEKTVVMQEGCYVCSSCGNSKCG